MKNVILIILLSLGLTIKTYAEHPYKDGAIIKIDNKLTFTCSNFKEYSFILKSNNFWNQHQDIFQSKFESIVPYNGRLVDNSQLYRSLEEVFTQDEIDAFAAKKGVYISLEFGLDHRGNVINVDMDIKYDSLTTSIKPMIYAKLRGVLMKNLKFIIDKPNVEMSCYRTYIDINSFQTFKDRAIRFR